MRILRYADCDKYMQYAIFSTKFTLLNKTQALLTVDFEIGHYIRERIVPRAVLFFTGEALDEESDYDEDEEDEDEDDEDGSGSDNDADFDPKKAQANPECKQQ